MNTSESLHRLEVNVSVGRQRRLVVRRLSSYDKAMGRVNVSLQAHSGNVMGSWVIDGWWTESSSLVRSEVIELPPSVSEGAYRLRFELMPSLASSPSSNSAVYKLARQAPLGLMPKRLRRRTRFKLLGVITC